jgi:hypothetical protein
MKRLVLVLLALLAACEPQERPPKTAREKPCPPPPEPDRVAVVVGTIGKMHLVESRYGLSKLGDVLAAFKPDLVLVQVRVDPFREGRLEDGSFEMTYVTALAKQHGASVEPIDWFREEDRIAPPPAADPWDANEIVKREADILAQPPLFTFDQANGNETFQRVLGAELSLARYRGGNPLATRRRAWIEELAASAVKRHDYPKRVLAYVDVFDRPAVDLVLHGVGYTSRGPVEIVQKAKETMLGDLSPEVLEDWRKQLVRLRARLEKAQGAERALVVDRERVLTLAIEKRGACCVPTSAFEQR